ncbi:haloalkane dehalogenase, partial [Neisseria meningitidis]
MPAGAPPIDCRYGLPGYYARVQAFSPTHLEAPMTEIDPTPLTKRRLAVDGKQMAYHESGEGRSVVFLHGNPTSSYLWRNIIPHVSDRARCISSDLAAQGDSDKLDDTGPGSFRFVEHRHYLDGLLDQLDLGDDVVLVIHDWGSALGFDWANRHRERIGGIAFMEAIVRPV